jgi:ribosome-binding factor A
MKIQEATLKVTSVVVVRNGSLATVFLKMDDFEADAIVKFDSISDARFFLRRSKIKKYMEIDQSSGKDITVSL